MPPIAQSLPPLASTAAALNLSFSYYEPLGVLAATPSSGPPEGDTLIYVAGTGFVQASGVHCKFGEVRVDATLMEVRDS